MNKKSIGEYLPDEYVTACEYFKQVIDDAGITQYEVSKGISVHTSSISRLYYGDSRISASLALRLERYLGIPAEVWLYLQMCDDIRASKSKYVDVLNRITLNKKMKVKHG